jgi:hypothetical protein
MPAEASAAAALEQARETETEASTRIEEAAKNTSAAVVHPRATADDATDAPPKYHVDMLAVASSAAALERPRETEPAARIEEAAKNGGSSVEGPLTLTLTPSAAVVSPRAGKAREYRMPGKMTWRLNALDAPQTSSASRSR